MKTTKMLKKNYEFRKILTKGKIFSGKAINAFVLKNNKNQNFIGLAVSTKIGKAVQRNRIKRLLRENYKNFEDDLNKSYSIVFSVKKNYNIDEITYKQVYYDMIRIFKNAKILK